MVLSGMGNTEMINDNINTFKDFKPVTEDEFKLFDNIREIIRKVNQIPCTKCNYCAEVCPVGIPISQVFTVHNKFVSAKISRSEAKEELSQYREKMAECIKCRVCESTCPQSIKISDELERVEKVIGR